MEKRQLDLNAPLLSARRFQSPTNSSELVKRRVVEKPLLSSRQQSLPVNKSDWECDEVTKPAAIPFHWEQIPGRPKDEVGSHSHTPDEPSNTPRLPPGRVSNASRHDSGEIPKLPPGRVSGPLRCYSSGDQNIFRPQVESFNFSDHASLLEKLNESLKCRDESDSESGDEAFSDALDTLSLSESWSLNYSVSGISGYQSSGVKPSGTFCIDAQTRDFMMNRFLPAAKAAVVETPKNAVKKPSAFKEQQPKQVKKAVSGEMKPSVKQYSSDHLPYYSQYIDNVESEDEEQESIAPVKKSGKAWGFLPRGMIPRFCVKNSLCLLNPLPSMKPKSRPPSPAPREVRRMSRNAHSGPLDKIPSQVIQKKRFHSGLLSRESTDDSNEFFNSRVSPLRRYRSGSISPYRNESPKSPFREGAGFLGVPKEVENFNANKIASSRRMFKALQDVSRNQISEQRGSDPTGDPEEKTVYIDYVKKKDFPRLMPSCTKAEQVVDTFGERSKVFKDNHIVKFDPDKSSMKEGKKQSHKFGSTDKVPRSAHVSKLRHVADTTEDIKQNSTLHQESRALEVLSDAKSGPKEEQKQELDLPSKSPLAPPLPKSPSESWLWRTMPSITLGNPFANSRRSSPIRQKKQGQKGSAANTKWETIVKSSNVGHDHVHYSQELVPRASLRQSKS
ncbi:hypothetical protein ACS0TY_031479 [Phlomoides rotata]